MDRSMIRLALVLGFLSLAGPFAIDMYLPALPEMALELGATQAVAQSTLTAYFITFGLAQMIYGPWADQVGRRRPIFVGMGLFVIGSLGAATAQSVETLIAWRALQGAGGAVAMVVPRAIIRDVHTGPQGARLMAMIMLVISVSPMIAPLTGSAVIAVAGWRAIFGVLCLAALASVILTATMLPETHPPEARVRVAPRRMLRDMGSLLRHREFMGLTFLGGLGTASFFLFLATAPFVYTGEFGLSTTGFAVAFAINAVGFFSASQAAGPLGARLGMGRVVRLGCIGFCTAVVALWLVAMAGFATLPVVVGFLFAANAGLGLVIPSVMVMALDDQGRIAGLASSLGGTLQMVTGGLAIVLAGPFFDGTTLPMVTAIALCGLGVLALAALTVGMRDAKAA